MAIILYSDKTYLLKSWYKSLEGLGLNIYVTKIKAELFEYFNTNKNQSILIMENDLNDEKNEEFLALLKRAYTWVRVCILSFNPNLKEGSEYLKLGVKGYGNAYMHSLHVKAMIKNIINDKFWYFPEFLEAFLNKQVNINMSEIGKVSSVKNLVLAKTNDEEHIVLPDEKIYQNEIFTTPYKDSYIQLELTNKRLIHVSGDSRIYLEKSIFVEDDLSEFCVFSKEKSIEILSYLGLVSKEEILEYKDKRSKNEELDEGNKEEIVARYSGKFEQYKIKSSKKLSSFLIVEDMKKNRDGCDIVNEQIDKFIFLDITKTYDELLEEIS